MWHLILWWAWNMLESKEEWSFLSQMILARSLLRPSRIPGIFPDFPSSLLWSIIRSGSVWDDPGSFRVFWRIWYSCVLTTNHKSLSWLCLRHSKGRERIYAKINPKDSSKIPNAGSSSQDYLSWITRRSKRETENYQMSFLLMTRIRFIRPAKHLKIQRKGLQPEESVIPMQWKH